MANTHRGQEACYEHYSTERDTEAQRRRDPPEVTDRQEQQSRSLTPGLGPSLPLLLVQQERQHMVCTDDRKSEVEIMHREGAGTKSTSPSGLRDEFLITAKLKIGSLESGSPGSSSCWTTSVWMWVSRGCGPSPPPSSPALVGRNGGHPEFPQGTVHSFTPVPPRPRPLDSSFHLRPQNEPTH